MKAVILAAGMGTRLGTLIPKPLSPLIDEKTILDFQVEHLAEEVGINNIIVVTGYKKEIVMERFPHLMYVYNEAYATTNTAKSLLRALEKIDDDALWLNGDVYFERSVLQKLLESPGSSCLVNTLACGDEEIKYTLNGDGYIHELSKSVSNGLGEAVGINFIQRDDLRLFREELLNVQADDYFERALENLTLSGRLRLRPVELGTEFCKEIDFETDLQEVISYIRQSQPQC